MHANPVQVMPQPQRVEDVLLAVAWVGSKDQVADVERMTEADFVAANKKKGAELLSVHEEWTFS
jgi:hypothetical protein